MVKYSIIVPVFNSELYLDACLESISNQKLQNYEVLLVDDGSTDKTKNICKKYLSNKFKYFYQKNQGVSAARNFGLSVAQGKFIIFVDSDDTLKPDFLNIIDSNIDDVDLLIFEYYRSYKNCTIREHIPFKSLNISDLEKQIFNNNIGGYLWNKVFKSQIIKKNNLSFNSNVYFSEDLLFTFQYIKYIQEVKVLNNALYFYRMRKNSATFLKSSKQLSVFIALDLMHNESEDPYIMNKIDYIYIWYYYFYRVKKNNIINYNILKKERSIIKNLSKKELLKFFLVKKIPLIYKLYQKIMNWKYVFYS